MESAPAPSNDGPPAVARADIITAGASDALGLGLDAGGTRTRWALADAAGQVWAEGAIAPMSGQQLASPEGRRDLVVTLQALARAVSDSLGLPPRPTLPATALPPRVRALVAGITGFDSPAMPQWRSLAAQALQWPESQVRALSDIELACAAAFAPGQGVVLVAGTGSIAAHVDAGGLLHRAGGRGAVIDDAGGGHWIARQALRQIWRAEDEQPGSWQASPLARQVFAHIGGSDWAQTRQWVYGATRGELGTLALAVAQAADSDVAAAALLQQAGQELARLVLALQHRLHSSHGAQPVAITGRVFELHPLVESSLRQALPARLPVQRLRTPSHHAAARLAAGVPPSTTSRDNHPVELEVAP